MKEQLSLLVRTKHGISKGFMWVESTQLNPTFDCWTHSFPFLPKSTWKYQKQNRKKNGWIDTTLNYFPYQNHKMKTSLPICTRCSPGDKMKYLNALVRKDLGNEGLGSQIWCKISCTGLSTNSITGAYPITPKLQFLPLLLGFEARFFWQPSPEYRRVLQGTSQSSLRPR